MTYHIDIQIAVDEQIPLTETQMTELATLALAHETKDAELTLRLVSPDEMQHLNHTYRQQNKTTNVLAFPSNIPKSILLDHPFLGDIIICPEVLLQESLTLKKDLKEHWSLIIIHGVLHLLGYDHIQDDDALIMQAIEVELLAKLGYNNPYDTEENKLE